MMPSEDYPNKLTLVPAHPPKPSLLKVHNDFETMVAWIAARSGCIHTARANQREAKRQLWWSTTAARTRWQMGVVVCGEWMARLHNILAT